MKCLTVDELKQKTDSGEMSLEQFNDYVSKNRDRIINVTRHKLTEEWRARVLHATDWKKVGMKGTKHIRLDIE